MDKKNETFSLKLSPLINRRHRKTRNRYSFGCVEVIILCLIIVVALFMMLQSALKQAGEKARRIGCSSNLKQIRLSLKHYSIDYSDRFPHLPGAAGLELLRKNDYLTDYEIYVCPSTQTTRGSLTVPLTQGNVNANCDYAFAAPMMEGDSNTFGRADSGIAADIFRVDISKTNNCSAPNHQDFGNILFHDGHVSGFAGAEWYSYDNRGGSYMWPNVEAVEAVEPQKGSPGLTFWTITSALCLIFFILILYVGRKLTTQKEKIISPDVEVTASIPKDASDHTQAELRIHQEKFCNTNEKCSGQAGKRQDFQKESRYLSEKLNNSPDTITSIFSPLPPSPPSIQETKSKSISLTTIVIVIVLIVIAAYFLFRPQECKNTSNQIFGNKRMTERAYRNKFDKLPPENWHWQCWDGLSENGFTCKK